MCSLHLTHPSVHTWSSGQPTVQRPGSSRGLPVGAGIRTHNLGLPRVSSPTLYPLGQRHCPVLYNWLNYTGFPGNVCIVFFNVLPGNKDAVMPNTLTKEKSVVFTNVTANAY